MLGAGVRAAARRPRRRTRRWRTSRPRSGRAPIAWWTGSNRSAPSTSIVVVPAPSTLAPIADQHVGEVLDLGLAGRVVDRPWCPCAATAAINRFSVAPTLGKSSEIARAVQPRRRRLQVAVLRRSNETPMRSRPLRWRSILREPMLQPPGMATRARPSRARSGPSTMIEARIRLTSSYGASGSRPARRRSRRCRPPTGRRWRPGARAPRPWSGSRRCGARSRSPSPRRQQGRGHQLQRGVLGPPMSTAPRSGRPPETTNLSIGRSF